MDFIQELKQNTINEITKLNQLLTILEEKTNKQELMKIRRQMIYEKYHKCRRTSFGKLKLKSIEFNQELKININKLLKEFDEMFNIVETDYTVYDTKNV
jgi:DNA gyrase/topoisomerase IV subunit A